MTILDKVHFVKRGMNVVAQLPTNHGLKEEGGRPSSLVDYYHVFFLQNELTLTHNRENRWRADIRVILSVKFLAKYKKKWQWSFSKLTLGVASHLISRCPSL